MPNGPSSELLRKFGINIPEAGGPPIDTALQNRIALEEQSKMPIWKQYAQMGLDALVGGVKGFIGVEPEENESYAGRKSNLGIQALTAGLPFAALTKGKPIFHGSTKVFEKFNPELYDTSDVLGWMTHGAADPEYAARYAYGDIKHGGAGKPNIIAMKPEAKNVLDLVDPNPDDISQALAAVDPSTRQHMLSLFKDIRRYPDEGRKWLKGLHYPNPESIPDEEVGIRRIADILRLSPEEFEKTPFDAIRYRDVKEESFAIPVKTPIKSAYGAPLTETPKELKVIKDVSDRPYTGTAEIIRQKPKSIMDIRREDEETVSSLQKYMQEQLANIPTSKKKLASPSEYPGEAFGSKTAKNLLTKLTSKAEDLKIGDMVNVNYTDANGKQVNYNFKIKTENDINNLKTFHGGSAFTKIHPPTK